MISRSTLALLIAIAALFPASVAFAQTREIFGPVLPMIYDGQGGRHYCLYATTDRLIRRWLRAAMTTSLFVEVDSCLRRGSRADGSLHLAPEPGRKR
jgi:hypothetical protein